MLKMPLSIIQFHSRCHCLWMISLQMSKKKRFMSKCNLNWNLKTIHYTYIDAYSIQVIHIKCIAHNLKFVWIRIVYTLFKGSFEGISAYCGTQSHYESYYLHIQRSKPIISSHNNVLTILVNRVNDRKCITESRFSHDDKYNHFFNISNTIRLMDWIKYHPNITITYTQIGLYGFP